MREGWNVVIRYDEAIAGTNIWFIHKQGNQETVVCPLNLAMTVSLVPGMQSPEPTIRIDKMESHQFLQGLAEGLVDAGFVPDRLKVSSEVLEATKDHLEDMRTLVFQALLPPEVPPPRLGIDKKGGQ